MTPPNGLSLVSPDDQRVTFVELFFDLVFVFSVTQVVGLLHDGVTWAAVARATLVFWLVWWAWTQFTWALNAANTDHPRIQLSILLATAVAFFLAVGVPVAFGEGALRFAGPYVAVRLIGLWVYSRVTRYDEAHHAAVRTFSLVSVGGMAAVLLGASLGGPEQYWFWGFAILLDVIAALVGGQSEHWNLHPDHFVERHGLIVIIALGESLIVAAGGLAGAEPTGVLLAVTILGVATTCGLWWSYFPYVRPALERAMRGSEPGDRGAVARDTFSLAHFPMLCGVIGFAAGLEEAILHPTVPLPMAGRLALALGLALFLLGTGLAKLRAVGRMPVRRVVVVVIAGSLIVGLPGVSPVLSLSIGLLAVAVVVVFEQRMASREREAAGAVAPGRVDAARSP